MATLAEMLTRATAALDERFAKAQAGGFTITPTAELAFGVTNGSGVTYQVAFSQRTPTGACTCEDFLARGNVLHACKHIAAVVHTQWPDRWDRWEAKVRAAAHMAVRALPADPDPEPEPASAPAPEPAPAVTPGDVAGASTPLAATGSSTGAPASSAGAPAPDAATVQLVSGLALPIIMELVMDALAQHAEVIVAKVRAELRGEGPQPTIQGGAAD